MINSNNSHVTPYQAAKLVNAALADLEIDKVLPPQMFYNYTTARTNKGKEPFIKHTTEGIEVADLQRWFDGYVKKNFKVETQVADPEQAAFDMAEAN